MSSSQHPSENNYIALPQTREDKIAYVLEQIEKEVKGDRQLVEYIFYSGLSNYTNNPVNLQINSRNPGEGKSYVMRIVLSYFPSKDVVKIIQSSNKALLHEKGELVIKDEDSDRWTKVDPILAELEKQKFETEKKFAEKKDPTDKEEVEHEEELANINNTIAEFKAKAIKRITLEHKILAFLDTPNPMALEPIYPLMSHDEYESSYKFTDKKGGSMQTTSNQLWGWPTIMVAQVLDTSERKRYPEWSRRVIMVNPSTSKEKVREALKLSVKRRTRPKFLYEKEVISQETKDIAKKYVQEITDDILELTRYLKNPDGTYNKDDTPVLVPYGDILWEVFPQETMNELTNWDRFSNFQILSTVMQLNRRPMLVIIPSQQMQEDQQQGNNKSEKVFQKRIPITVFADTKKAIELMKEAANTGLRPEVMKWYEEVFMTTYDAKTGPDWKIDKKKGKRKKDWVKVEEDRKAVRATELVDLTQQVFGSVLSTDKLQYYYLDPLFNNGMIEIEKSKLDARHNIYYPVEALLSSPQKKSDTKLEKKKVFSNFLQDGKFHLPDISLYPTKEYVKSKILSDMEQWKKDGFLVKLYDGFDVEIKYEEDSEALDSLLNTYFSEYHAEACFVVDRNEPFSVNSIEGENKGDLQTTEQKDEKPREPERQYGEKLEKEAFFSNFISGKLEKNPQADIKIPTKTFNQRWQAVNDVLKQVDELTKEGRSLTSLAIKDSAIVFDTEYYDRKAGGKLFQFGVMDVLTEQPVESIRITDPHIAGDYKKFMKTVDIALTKRQHKNEKGEIVDDYEVINEQSFGWWSRGYDSDLIHIDKNGYKKAGIPSKIAYSAVDNKPFIIGQEHIDLHAIYNNNLIKNNIFKNAYRALDLGHVGKKVVGLGKYKDFNGAEAMLLPIDEQKIYNMRDCEITCKLAKALDGRLMALMKVISELLIMPFVDTCHTELPQWWAHLFDSEGAKKSQDLETGESYSWDYDGGLVAEPPIGQQQNIRMLDVASLYPSMVRKYNLSFDTIECDCCEYDKLAYVPKDVLVSRLGDKPIERHYWVCRKQKGTFPKFLDEFTDLRLQFKREYKNTKKKIYDILSTGLKIVLNGGYGCFAYHNFDYEDVRVAELTTSYGRYTLRKIMEIASKYSLMVLYGDTDSVFVKGDNATNKEIIEEFIKEANNALNIELEDDKLFVRCIITSKKHYLGVFWDDKEKRWDIIVKGMEGGKADRPPFVNRMWEQFLSDYKNGIDVSPAIVSTLKKLVNKELPPEDFRFEIQLHYTPDHYGENYIQYKIGKLMNASKGDLVWFYKIHNEDKDREKILEKKDGGYQAHQNPANISYEKALTTVESTFSSLLQYLGHNPEELFQPFREQVPKDEADPFQETLKKKGEESATV